jgi:Holliday junction resolvase RusA-like endonuclease
MGFGLQKIIREGEKVLKFTLFISPKAQKRVRARAFKVGSTYIAQTYKDTNQRHEEEKLITLLYAHKPRVPLSGPLRLAIKAYLPIPQSKSKKWVLMASQGQIRPTTKPDCDNLAKQMLDVMNGVFFSDDRQIVSLLIEKHYSEIPKWEIEVEEMLND